MSPGQVMRIMESQALYGLDTKLKRKGRPIGFGGLAFWIWEVLDIPIRVGCFGCWLQRCQSRALVRDTSTITSYEALII